MIVHKKKTLKKSNHFTMATSETEDSGPCRAVAVLGSMGVI